MTSKYKSAEMSKLSNFLRQWLRWNTTTLISRISSFIIVNRELNVGVNIGRYDSSKKYYYIVTVKSNNVVNRNDSLKSYFLEGIFEIV